MSIWFLEVGLLTLVSLPILKQPTTQVQTLSHEVGGILFTQGKTCPSVPWGRPTELGSWMWTLSEPCDLAPVPLRCGLGPFMPAKWHVRSPTYPQNQKLILLSLDPELIPYPSLSPTDQGPGVIPFLTRVKTRSVSLVTGLCTIDSTANLAAARSGLNPTWLILEAKPISPGTWHETVFIHENSLYSLKEMFVPSVTETCMKAQLPADMASKPLSSLSWADRWRTFLYWCDTVKTGRVVTQMCRYKGNDHKN